MLASQADREAARAVLEQAFEDQRLNQDEFEARVGRALAARTQLELAELTQDLPPLPVKPASRWKRLWSTADQRSTAQAGAAQPDKAESTPSTADRRAESTGAPAASPAESLFLAIGQDALDQLSSAGTPFNVPRTDLSDPRVAALVQQIRATSGTSFASQLGARTLESPAAPNGGVPLFSLGGAQFGVVAAPDAMLTIGELLHLRGASEPADAVVSGVAEATLPPGMLSPSNGVVDVTLEVTKSDGSVYGAVMRVPCGTPKSRDLVSTAGTRLSVRIDPSNPRVLAIDIASVGGF
jgi:hypothetical protein